MSAVELDVPQGEAEWMAARLGRPTASQASRIVTRTGKPSSQADAYMAELLAEYFLGHPVTEFDGNVWTERGKALEPDAFALYAFHVDSEPRTTGIVYRDESRLFGASPDGLVDPDGGLELKAPMPGTHLLWLARGECPPQHWCQVQASIWATGRKWWDFMSYYPDLPPLIVRVEPDATYQAALDKHIPAFIGELLSGRERLRELGVEPALEDAA